MQAEILHQDDIRLLTELGFVGAGAGLWQPAQQIFEALAVLRPYRDFPYIGLATLQLNQKKPDEAAQTLDKARQWLATHPEAQPQDQAMLAVFHAVALHCAQRTAQSQQVLQSVLQMGYHSESALRLARTMLGEMGVQLVLENP
jgi:uncharacterized protein HemY